MTDATEVSETEGFTLVYVMNSWGDPNSTALSLPSLVENEGDHVQQAICEWLQLFKMELHSATRAVLNEDPTLAELHPLFEGNYATTPEHFELAQLIMLCRSLRDRDVVELVYRGSNMSVARCLTTWCKAENISFIGPRIHGSVRSRIQTVLSRWRSWFRLYWACRNNVSHDITKLQDVTTAFVDYLVADPIETYWRALRDIATFGDESCFFIHQFTKTNALSTVALARLHCNNLRRDSSQPLRTLLEDGVGISDIALIRKNITLLRRVGKLTTTVSPPQVPYMAGLQPLALYSERLARRWNDSTVVDTAMKMVAFKNLLSWMPKLHQVIYLQENHCWEKALLREANQRRLRTIGVPHTVVRPRDLRYHLITRDSQSDQFLFPTIVATNGPATRDELARGIASSQLTAVEAQRYQSLTRLQWAGSRTKQAILIAGDLLPDHSQFILDTALPVLRHFDVTVYFKPHPADLGSRALAEATGANILDGDFHQALSHSSLLIAGSLTAASAEAVHVGIPVVTIVDPSFFNLSPLLRLPFARFARTSSELRIHIEQLLVREVDERREMFTIDHMLPKWRRLLSVE